MLLLLVAQTCLTLCDPMDCSTPFFPVHPQLLDLSQTHVLELVMTSNHLILCCRLLLPPSIFPSIRIFSNESVLRTRKPKNWSFSYSISPSNEYSGLISFRFAWFDLLADSQESSPVRQFESISSSVLNLLNGPTLTSAHDNWKNHCFDNSGQEKSPGFGLQQISLQISALSLIAVCPRAKAPHLTLF